MDLKIFFILGSEWVGEILLLLGKDAGCEKNFKKFGFLPEKSGKLALRKVGGFIPYF